MPLLSNFRKRWLTRAAFLRLLDWLILSVFFMIPWRLQIHADWLPTSIDRSFLIMLPVTLSLEIWLLLGAPGLRSALRDRRRWWLLLIFALIGWIWLSTRWSPAPSLSTTSAQGFTIAALFTLMVTSIGPSPRRIAQALAMGVVLQSVIAIGQVAVQHRLGIDILGETQLTVGDPDFSMLVA